MQEEMELLQMQVEELEEASKKTVISPAPDSSPVIYDVSRKGNRK